VSHPDYPDIDVRVDLHERAVAEPRQVPEELKLREEFYRERGRDPREAAGCVRRAVGKGSRGRNDEPDALAPSAQCLLDHAATASTIGPEKHSHERPLRRPAHLVIVHRNAKNATGANFVEGPGPCVISAGEH
jgi:hypothetical protein